MPVTSVTQLPDTTSVEIIADYPVSPSRSWNAYADPRQLERFWGPPTYPATFTRHDLAVGGRASYVMTGPDGDTSGGYWEFTDVEAPSTFTVKDGFVDDAGEANTRMPEVTMSFRISGTEDGARLSMTTTFGDASDMEKLVDMGMVEGMKAALGQLDAVLAEPDPTAPGTGTTSMALSDTVVRVSRVLSTTVEQAWRAHHDVDLLRQWQLGPDGWFMPVCEFPSRAGETYRFGWVPDPGTEGEGYGPFGFTGTVLEDEAPYRSVTTERMTDGEGTPVPDGPETRNELTFSPTADGTLLTLVITYPDQKTRDMILGTGMIAGMELSYARLERLDY